MFQRSLTTVNSGKVCLSILGTWRGEAGEQWSSAHGLLSVLISIQSLMSDKPYVNEPGFENPPPSDQKLVDDYNKKIMHETLRVSVCDRLEAYLGWKSNDVKQVVNEESAKVKDGTAFTKMRFEGGSNSMEGAFAYGTLRTRLESIYKGLMDEIEDWKRESKAHIKADTTTSHSLLSQFQQIQNSNTIDGNISVELRDNNPYIWIVTIIGLPASSHDGALYKAEMVFSNEFPDALPKVRFLTEVFHPNISRDGFPYYRTLKPEDVRSHLSAIAALFTQDPDPQPATHLNATARDLYFGTEAQKKDFRRRVRRCAQKSADFDDL
ncbi:hypothetical protein SmJEL517_g01121 [Synchytrium microbalum]|uniref:UBC core domain-containing protein n=1 Tax=Synchytrium microbalum TaxID=1806994 RepID=A0A507CCH4_9FUNG|nr:uncharacterized protein SmJEL517_g01121 [Synchytrium microbalum]TPX37201.1 hypothetical protein SmJEL517_g01121 [Synchytrium microbalum]